MAAFKPRRILLLTNVDRGEANVFLATAAALVETDSSVELHFATFPGLEEPVAAVSQNARRHAPDAREIVYHSISGLTMADGLKKYLAENNVPRKDDYLPLSFLAPLRFSTTLKAIGDTIPIMVPYGSVDMAEIVSCIIDIINSVKADLVVVDTLMTAALTACYHLGVKFACLSPNAIKEFAAPVQPWAAGLWRYPALFSGYSFPVPLHLIPFNIFLTLYTAHTFIGDSHRHAVAQHLASNLKVTLRTPIDLLRNRPDNVKILVSTLPELDFPSIIPDHVLPCGPIVQTASPIAESDPELEQWLAAGPVIYINLGSICLLAEDQALRLAKALRCVLDRQDTPPRVLWKLKPYGDYKVTTTGSKIHDVLGPEIDADQVRIVTWVQADPFSILQTGHILCSVHHGGANSYNEAVLAGVPQVVLPQWTDCYDYAQRVELLGIGRIGNKTCKPKWETEELSQVLLDVAFGKESGSIKKTATHLASICHEHGSGAAHAAKILLAECDQ